MGTCVGSIYLTHYDGAMHCANDLSNMVPSPYSEFEPVRPLSPEIIKGVPAGAKSDMDSLGVEDSEG